MKRAWIKGFLLVVLGLVCLCLAGFTALGEDTQVSSVDALQLALSQPNAIIALDYSDEDYLLVGDTLIPAGVTLTIPQGVRLFNEGILTVQGNLVVEGTLVSTGNWGKSQVVIDTDGILTINGGNVITRSGNVHNEGCIELLEGEWESNDPYGDMNESRSQFTNAGVIEIQNGRMFAWDEVTIVNTGAITISAHGQFSIAVFNQGGGMVDRQVVLVATEEELRQAMADHAAVMVTQSIEITQDLIMNRSAQVGEGATLTIHSGVRVIVP